MGYPASGYSAPAFPTGPQQNGTVPNYPAIPNQSVRPYGYSYNSLSTNRLSTSNSLPTSPSTPNQFGPQTLFTPSYHPYAFNAQQQQQQYFQQPYPPSYPPVSQPIIQYVPVIRPPVTSSQGIAKPQSLPITPPIQEPSKQEADLPKAIIATPKEEELVKTLETPETLTQAGSPAKNNISPKPVTKSAPAGFAEETGDRVGAWITGFLKEHPEWENKIKQFDLPSHLDTLGQGLATGQMPDVLKGVRDQFNQSWLLRQALPWLEKPLLAKCPFEYRIPLTQFFKWLRQKPEKI